MSQCSKCAKPLSQSEKLDALKCVICDGVFHLKCSGVGTTTRAQKTEFRCEKCKSTVSVSNAGDSDEPGNTMSVLKAINELKISMDSKLQSLEDSVIKRLDNKFQTVNDKIADVSAQLSNSVADLKAENQQLREKCDELEDKVNQMSQEVLKLKEEMGDLQQYSRVQNVEVAGVPVTEGEDVYAVLEGIAKIIQVPWNRNAISIAHRLGLQGKNNQPPSIVVRFISRTTRAEWLQAARAHDIKTTQLNSNLRPGSIFINEHLLPFTKLLLSKAKTAVKDKKLAYAWVKEGKLFVRKSENGRAKRVKSLLELESIVGKDE